jgi:hypothetical protein
MQHQLAVEVQEQVLAMSLDLGDGPALEPRRPTIERVARMWGLDRVRDHSLQDGANPVGRPGDRVPLGHPPRA